MGRLVARDRTRGVYQKELVGVALGAAPPVDIVASYAKNDILMSGWALGEEKYIAGRAAVVKVEVGAGEVVLFAFRPQFRGQPRGTYKLLFNALQGAAAGK
jgi:hypothetical protein